MARKLTLMSEMKERFVADRRLWRWIEDAMNLKDIAPAGSPVTLLAITNETYGARARLPSSKRTVC